MSHIKDDEKKGEDKILNDIENSFKIKKGKKSKYQGLKRNGVESMEECLLKEQIKQQRGIGLSDIGFYCDTLCVIFESEGKSGKGEAKTGKISMHQIRLWKGEPTILECSRSPAYDVDYCVIPANFLIRKLLDPQIDKNYNIYPEHQVDGVMCALMAPKPEAISRDFGCSAEELETKIREAQKEYEDDLEIVEIVKRTRQRMLDIVEENNGWGLKLSKTNNAVFSRLQSS